MVKATIFEAKTNLSALIKKVEKGETVIITSGRKKTPVAKLEPIQPIAKKRLGALYDPNFKLTDAFWEPLPEEELKLWDGEGRVKVLLDTHTRFGLSSTPVSLSNAAVTVIDDKANIILISAASDGDRTKVRKGKLPGAEAFERDFLHTLDNLGYALLSIDAEAALRAARLTGNHRDPFDRMIAAQALALDIPVISKDPKLDQFGVRRIW